MSHVEQLEQEAEQTRSRIADTLDELKATMTPGHILDQLADRISDGAPAAFARNLKDQTVNNPLPVALVGAGLAWLMLSPRRGRRSGAPLRNAADDAADGVRVRPRQPQDPTPARARHGANEPRALAMAPANVSIRRANAPDGWVATQPMPSTTRPTP